MNKEKFIVLHIDGSHEIVDAEPEGGDFPNDCRIFAGPAEVIDAQSFEPGWWRELDNEITELWYGEIR